MSEEQTKTEETTTQPQPSAEDMATYEFQKLLPKFYDKIEELANRQLKRVVKALIEYPLEGTAFRFSYVKEAEAFDLGMRIMDCKFIIMKAVMDMTADQRKELLNQLEAIESQEKKGA